ncbi:MAG: hypothetical protein IJ400_06110 [Clostridia bacterium]|nr:hypothetical protein [Clostridia bacterium]
MKRVLAILLCLLLCLGVVAMAACNNEGSGDPVDPNGGQQTHVHTFKTDADWSKDASGHWYDATCDCADVTLRKLQHVDDNKDAICDVCKFEYDHEHTYAEDWTADCTNHWYTANCGCIIAGDQIGKHADENGDGECDVCKYVINDLHNHYYATEWSSDAENHWHAALCEHSVEVADKAAHNLNDAGYCTVCNAKVREIDRTDLLAVLKAAVANNHKVVTGTVIADEMVYGSGNALETGKTNKVFFVLGNEDSYVEWGSYDKTGTFIGVDEYYQETLADGTIFAVQIPYYDGASRNNELKMFPVDGDPHKLNGYNYTPGNILSAGYDDNSTLAQTLANLYDILVLNVNVLNPETSYDAETGKYAFSYSFFTVNKTEGNTSLDGSGEDIVSYYVEYFNVSAEFTVDANFVIDNATFEVESFRNLDGVDVDLSYDPDTNTVTLLSTKSATTYTYTVAQTSGERTYSTIYPKASLVPQGFELYSGTAVKDPDTYSVIGFDNKVLLGDTVTITEKVYTYLVLGDPYPITSSFSFLNTDDISVTWVNNDPNSTGKLATMDPYFSWGGQYIAFFPKDDGSYTMTIKIGDVTREIVINIGEQALVPPADTADTKYVVVTDTNTWVDEYTFTAPEAGTYTFTIPANLGFFVADASAPVTDPFDPYYVAQAVNYEVDLAQGQTLTFNVGAQAKGIFAIGVAFTAGEVGGGDEGEDFDYTTTIVEGNNTLYFSQDEITAGTATRPLTITVAGVYQFNGDLFVSGVVDSNNTPIEKVDDKFTLAPGSYIVTFGMFSLTGTSADTACAITLVNTTAEDDEEQGGTTTTLNATYYAYQEGNTILTVAFSDDGTVVFSYLHPMNPSTLTANYTIADGVVTLTDPTSGDELPQMAAYVTLTAGVPTVAGYSGWDYDLYAEGDTPSVDTPEDVELSKGDNTVPVTGDSNTMTNATITAEGTGVYYITVGTNAVVIADYATYLSGETAMLIAENAGDILTIQVNSEDFTEGAVNVNVSFVAKAADEPAKDELEGVYKSGDYTVELTRQYGTGLYLVTVTNADYSVCLQFTYTLTDNGDNSYTLSDLVNVPNQYGDAGTDKIDEIVANGITFSIDPMKEAITGTYVTIDDYDVGVIKENGEYFITIASGWDTTVYFTYTVTDNGDGTLTLDQAYVESINEAIGEGVDKATTVAEMEALVITINYDAEKEALNYYEYTGIDGYTVMFLKSEGVYYAYAFNADYTVQLYFTYTITAGVNGTQVIDLTYVSRQDYESGVDQTIIDTIEAHSIVLGGLEGEGTYESPYVIEEVGDYVAPYPGGYVYPYFQFTAPANGYVTISSAYEFFNLQYGKVIDTPSNNMGEEGYLNEIKVYLTEGATIYFNIADYNFPEEAVDVPFTIAFEEFVSDDTSFLEGQWIGIQSSMWGTATPYTFNFDANGTGSGSYTEWGSAVEFTINYTLVDGNSVTVNVTTSGMWAQELDFVFTYDSEADELTGDLTLEKGQFIALGSMQINGSAQNGVYTYLATEAMVIDLSVGGAIGTGAINITYSINGAEPVAVAATTTASIELAMNDVVVIEIDVASDTYTSITLAKNYPAGSEQNPIAIETLPYDIAVNGAHDKYYTYTATEDIVLTITAPDGCYVTNSKDVTGVDGVYTISLTAGESVTLNVWTTAADEIDYTYTITGEVQSSGDGEDGGEATGAVVYMSEKHTSGRYLQVTIDEAAGTMTLVRSNMSGGWDASTSTAEYTISGTGANRTATNVSGQACTIVFGDDGVPTSITWGAAEFVNFTQQ